jgi:hypothetical protein
MVWSRFRVLRVGTRALAGGRSPAGQQVVDGLVREDGTPEQPAAHPEQDDHEHYPTLLGSTSKTLWRNRPTSTRSEVASCESVAGRHKTNQERPDPRSMTLVAFLPCATASLALGWVERWLRCEVAYGIGLLRCTDGPGAFEA